MTGLVVGDFVITPLDDGWFWIERTDAERAGEGMQVSGDVFVKLIREFYEATF